VLGTGHVHNAVADLVTLEDFGELLMEGEDLRCSLIGQFIGQAHDRSIGEVVAASGFVGQHQQEQSW